MKTTIREKDGSIVIEYDNTDYCDNTTRIRREFCVFGCDIILPHSTKPYNFRYVREYIGNGNYQQVCNRLNTMGPTLMATNETLIDVIRREYRKMRQSEKRVNC